MSIEYDNPLVISPDPFLTNGQLRAEAVVVEGTMDLKAESATNLRDIAQLMTQQLSEMKLINMHLHELSRALNDGYPYSDDDAQIIDQL